MKTEVSCDYGHDTGPRGKVREHKAGRRERALVDKLSTTTGRTGRWVFLEKYGK